MRKQEFIHLHGLLAELAKYCREEEIEIDLGSYRTLETRSTSIHHSKDDHREAVLALAGALASGLEDDIAAEAEPVSAVTQ